MSGQFCAPGLRRDWRRLEQRYPNRRARCADQIHLVDRLDDRSHRARDRRNHQSAFAQRRRSTLLQHNAERRHRSLRAMRFAGGMFGIIDVTHCPNSIVDEVLWIFVAIPRLLAILFGLTWFVTGPILVFNFIVLSNRRRRGEQTAIETIQLGLLAYSSLGRGSGGVPSASGTRGACERLSADQSCVKRQARRALQTPQNEPK